MADHMEITSVPAAAAPAFRDRRMQDASRRDALAGRRGRTPGGSTLRRRSLSASAAPNWARSGAEDGSSSSSSDEDTHIDLRQSAPVLSEVRRPPAAVRREQASSWSPSTNADARPPDTAAPFWDANFFNRHLVLPYVLAGYLHFLLNLFYVCVLLYVVWAAVSTLRADVVLKVEEYSALVVSEIEECSRKYLANRCTPVSERVPAMQEMCTAWELCMQREPGAVGRARLSAQTFAEIIESFVEPISYKTMFFVIITLAGVAIATNLAFSLMRRTNLAAAPLPPASPVVQPLHASAPALVAPMLPPALPLSPSTLSAYTTTAAPPRTYPLSDHHHHHQQQHHHQHQQQPYAHGADTASSAAPMTPPRQLGVRGGSAHNTPGRPGYY